MTTITRRKVFGVGGAAVLAGAPSAYASEGPKVDEIGFDLRRYAGYGRKNSGGDGDAATGDWIAQELKNVGFLIRRQPVDVPWFEAKSATISVEGEGAPLLPIGIVRPTSDSGVSGPAIYLRPQAGSTSSLKGAVAVIDLPFQRWSSARSEPIRGILERAAAEGAAAAIFITNGPTGEAIALNSDGRAPAALCPSAVLAPKAAAPVLTAAMQSRLATVKITGAGGRREAFNVIATLKRGGGKWLVVSTPRSGWTVCGGERGPGIVAFLALARWAPAAFPDHNLKFLCHSGHEYENLGAAEALRSAAPKPAETDFWLHLGANLAARDWHEAGVHGLLPLPSADPQRFLLVSPHLMEFAKRKFHGLAGLESPYPTTGGADGELREIVAAGFVSVAGIFGAHRFHHVDGDDLRCVEPALVSPVVERLKSFLMEFLRDRR